MKFKQLSLELLVEDLGKSLAFYHDILGFETEVVFPDEHPVFAQVGKNDIHLKLYVRKEFENEIPKLKTMKMGGTIELFIDVEGVEEYFRKLEGKVVIIKPLHTTDYGTREFTIEDCNGYLICFAQENVTR